MCLWVSYKNKIWPCFFYPWKSQKKEAGSKADPKSDPDPHQDVTDPQHWLQGPDQELLGFQTHENDTKVYERKKTGQIQEAG
jgi:hypothetical protein